MEVSYGGTFVAKETMQVATIPVGYGDGYPRSLSNKGYVLIHGKKGADPRQGMYGSVYGRCIPDTGSRAG